MAVKYEAVQWNQQKKKYDRVLSSLLFGVVLNFVAFQLMFFPAITIETLIIRTSAITAFMLLHIILMIGPLTRIDDRFLPLLYNRRHLGVTMFVIACIHGMFSIIQFHALGDVNPIVSVFTSNQNYKAISEFPFQILGFFGLMILFLMAATSHDFWLKNLSPKVWKSLHMGVYLAYVLLVLHVALGALQYEDQLSSWIVLVTGFISVSGLHFAAGIKETKRLKNERKALLKDGFYEVSTVDEIPEHCAKTVFIKDQNIAIFKYDGKISAVHNVCKHQMGPLGEGKIIDGCITCPWHGYQYQPENGQAPSPFKEKLQTYTVRIIRKSVWVHPSPKLEGAFVEPAKVEEL